MKMFWMIAFAALVLTALAFSSIKAQDDDARARGLVVKFQSGTIDGMQVSVLKKAGAKKIPVEPEAVFKEGDEIWVSFASNFDGYVYIVNVMPDGQKRVLFPYRTGTDEQTSNLVRADQRYVLPKGDAFAFDENAGTEILQVIMSRDPIPYLDAAVKSTNGDLGNSSSSAAAELQGKASKQGSESGKGSGAGKRPEPGKSPDSGGIVTEDVAIVVPEGASDGVKTRDIRRVSVAPISASAKSPAGSPGAKAPRNSAVANAPPRARHRIDTKGSVVAIPDEPGKGGKLKPGELAVFEIRLKHV